MRPQITYFCDTSPKPEYDKKYWQHLLAKGKSMPLDENERREFNALWDKADETQRQASELNTRLAITSERVETLSRSMSEANGRNDARLKAIEVKLQELHKEVITMVVRYSTKGGLIDRWLPISIAVVAVLISAIKTTS